MMINKGILHIFDFNSNVCVFSQRELDFSNDANRSFIEKHIERVQLDAGQKHGDFLQDSAFRDHMEKYNQGKINFVEFSTLIGDMLYEQISKSEKLDSTDFLVVDFMSDDTPYIALLLMANKVAYTHEVINDSGVVYNEIIRHHAILPNTTQKADSFAIINRKDLSIGFVDKKQRIDGKDIFVLPDVILQCTSIISSKEAVKLVSKITTKIAEDHGANPAIAVSKAKNYLVENAEVSSSFSPVDLGREVFADSGIMQNEFESEIAEVKLPGEVKLEKSLAIRAGQKHKIKTDTGIEITIPANYFENNDYIEFINNPDGTISIELKNIGKIIN